MSYVPETYMPVFFFGFHVITNSRCLFSTQSDACSFIVFNFRQPCIFVMEKTTLTQCGGNTVDIDDLVFLGRFKSSKGVTLAIVDADTDVQNCAKLLDCAAVFVSVPKVLSQVRCQSNFLPLSVRPSPIFVKNGKCIWMSVTYIFISVFYNHNVSIL